MRSLYNRSIFAFEVEEIIAEHQLEMDDLHRSPLSLDRRKVIELANSLKSVKRLPALNYEEIETIVYMLGLKKLQRCRMYAALTALGVQRILLEYLSPERAWQVADEVRAHVLEWLLGMDDNNNPFRRIQKEDSLEESLESTQPVPADNAAGDVLAAALNRYDEGVLRAALARFHQEQNKTAEARRDYEQARVCLSQAMNMLKARPTQPSESQAEKWDYWNQEALQTLSIVEKALQGVQDAYADYPDYPR